MNGFKFHERYPLVKCPEYESVLDEFRCDNEQMLLMHIDVFRYSPSVRKRMDREWRCLRACTDALIFAIEPEPDDEKWERFVKPFGFVFSSRIPCTDGRSRRVFVSYPNGQQYHKNHKRDPLSVGTAAAIPA